MLNLDDIADVVAAAVAPFQAQLAEQQKTLDGLRDLRGIADAVIDRDGGLVLTFSDGRTKEMGRIVGKDGDNGATFTLDDFDIVQGDDERTFKFCFTHGAEMHSFEFAFPVAIYRGVWKEKEWQRGDMVTWAGSVWHADKATGAKPDTPDSGWRLAVKRGRDGKDVK